MRGAPSKLDDPRRRLWPLLYHVQFTAMSIVVGLAVLVLRGEWWAYLRLVSLGVLIDGIVVVIRLARFAGGGHWYLEREPFAPGRRGFAPSANATNPMVRAVALVWGPNRAAILLAVGCSLVHSLWWAVGFLILPASELRYFQKIDSICRPIDALVPLGATYHRSLLAAGQPEAAGAAGFLACVSIAVGIALGIAGAVRFKRAVDHAVACLLTEQHLRAGRRRQMIVFVAAGLGFALAIAALVAGAVALPVYAPAVPVSAVMIVAGIGVPIIVAPIVAVLPLLIALVE